MLSNVVLLKPLVLRMKCRSDVRKEKKNCGTVIFPFWDDRPIRGRRILKLGVIPNLYLLETVQLIGICLLTSLVDDTASVNPGFPAMQGFPATSQVAERKSFRECMAMHELSNSSVRSCWQNRQTRKQGNDHGE
jgi:hypothetical protein